MDTRPDQQLPTNVPPPPPPVSPASRGRLGRRSARPRVGWTVGRKIFAAVFLVVLVVFGIIVLLAFNSHRQTTSARERFAGVYENRDGTRIVLEADGDYDLAAYEMEGIAGEWELRENRTIPIGAFEPTELFIPYSQELGGRGQAGWTYRIGPNGRTLTLEHDGVPSDDPLDRYVRTDG